MDFLNKLNPQQRKAVTAADGPVLVVAGPGSGKTRVLTQRIAYLIASEGVRPWQILAVTFTNKAAKEMDQRVKTMLNEQATDGIMLGTFHSICARILRREVEHLPLESNFVIFDSDDQERIVKSIIKELNLNDKLYRAASIHAAISRAKNELIGPEDYPINTYRDEVVKRVYIEYQKRLIASNAVDFDDLLVYTARLLEENPSVRDKYAQRFRHVLVDEFQDTNLAQYALVKHLASHHKNIFCVGDPDQSIYAWRGADYRNVKRFEEDFPDAQIVLLEELQKGDTLIVWKLDRMGRSLHHLIKVVNDLIAKGVDIISIQDPLNTTSAQGRLIFNMFASLAEFEKDLIRERTIAGLKSARARGRMGGRPKGLSEKAKKTACTAEALYLQNELKTDDIAEQLGISKTTLYKYLRTRNVQIGAPQQL